MISEYQIVKNRIAQLKNYNKILFKQYVDNEVKINNLQHLLKTKQISKVNKKFYHVISKYERCAS